MPIFRNLVVTLRAYYFIKVAKSLRTFESKESYSVTVQHNLKSLMSKCNRMELLIRPLSVIETISNSSKILVIGPRNEHDLFLTLAYLPHVPSNNIRGLDLISYSPMIDIGDMHNTTYNSNSFDVIICGYTLSYSNNPDKFVCECVRILKPNGIIAIGVEYFDFDNYDLSNISGYSIPDNLSTKSSGYYLRSVQSIKDLFKDYLDTVYFSHDAPLKKSHTTQSLVSNPSNVFMILSINK